MAEMQDFSDSGTAAVATVAAVAASPVEFGQEGMDKSTYNTLDGGLRPQVNTRYFTVWVIISQIMGLAVVVMMAVWLSYFHGGFGWTSDYTDHANIKLMFNYHPLFMTIGIIFLYADGMLVYRVFRNERKIIIKILHAVIQLSVVVFIAVSLKAVFTNHNASGNPNLYTLHSWIGLTTVILFGIQWLIGFTMFLFPKASARLRGLYMPIHQFFGVAIFAMAVGTALMGILEKSIWSIPTYSKKSPEAILVNSLGVLILTHGVVVLYIVTRSEYKRQPLPEEESIQLTGSND
ncbi:transmembrane ascorbate-dependent reductase CYB561-like isoform X2 [Tubulanus polymorphus]|uniref:transmembrane ascorbate-dependent reductase CYB561-like isoform X2 n=1 Tax=Tubulanus polymorphus TaxID=672921 RepID=UPI003DA22AA8